MNNSAAKVGEIFREAGTAFNKLSEMTLMLQPMDDSPPGGKWSDAEVEMLRGCINRFAVELNKISQHIKNRTMRHLKCQLDMDSGTIQDISSSPPQQARLPQPLTQQSQPFTQQPQLWPQQPQLLPQQPQLSPQQPHPAQQINTQETESQFDLNAALVNIFSQGFPDNDDKDEDLDSFLLNFDPSEVNQTPPANITQEERIQQQPSSELENLQNSSYDRTLQAVPSLISLLDADVNNATPYSESRSPTECCMANIGTLHAELPNYGCNLDDATGASSNFQEINYDHTSSVSREAHFSLRQAQDTWNHVSSPATNQTTTIGSEEKPPDNFIIYTPLSCLQSSYTSVQASSESAFTNKIRGTESQYRPQLDTVSSLLAGNEEAIKYIKSEENPQGNILCPGTFNSYSLNSDPFGSVQAQRNNLLASNNEVENKEKPQGNILCPGSFGNYSLNNDPFRSVQARNDEHEGSSSNKILFTNLFGNSLYSANPNPVTSVPGQTNFSLIGADTNEQALASSARRTHGCRGRGRARRRREGPVTWASAEPIVSPPDESTAEPSQGRMTRSRRRQACHCDEIEDPVPKKSSRKKATTKTTPGPRTRAQKKKQSPK